jgi:hypothetical protein
LFVRKLEASQLVLNSGNDDFCDRVEFLLANLFLLSFHQML